jgi:uncharacterized membrane protein
MQGLELLRGFAGHPSHPPLTDAAIGTYTFATVAAVLSKLGISEENFAHAWWLALVVGLVFTVPTALAGALDWLTIRGGTPLKRTASVHALTMVAATVVFLLAVVIGHGGYSDAEVGTDAFVITLIAFGLLVLGGLVGGSITYVHGMRVLNLVDEPTAKAITPLPSPEKEEAARG